MRIGVLGGRGVAGAAAVAELSRRGHEVRALSRATGVDVATATGLPAALAGLDAVVDCLGSAGSGDAAARPILVDGLRRALAAAAEARVAHAVSLSIVGCERVPLAYYRVKVDQEAVVRAAPLPATIVRATQFPSLLDGAWRAARRTGAIPVVPGVVAPVDPRDVALVLADAVEAGPDGPPRCVCGPQDLTVGELARGWKQATGSRRPIVRLPAATAALKAVAGGALVDRRAARGTRTWAAWLAEHVA